MTYVIAEPSCIGTATRLAWTFGPVDCVHPRKDEPAFDSVELLINPILQSTARNWSHIRSRRSSLRTTLSNGSIYPDEC